MPPTIPKPVIGPDHLLGTVPKMRQLIHLAETEGMTEQEQQQQFMTPLGYHYSLYLAFKMMLRYRELGQQVFCIGPRLQQMFQATSLEGIPAEEFQMPYDTFYVALPGCPWRIWGGPTGWHPVDGVLVSLKDRSLMLYLWAQENENSVEAGDDASFWISLNLDEMASLGLDMESYIDKVIHDPARERQVDDNTLYFDGTSLGESFREQSQSEEIQQTARSVLRVVMNMTLYLGSIEPDLSNDPDFQKSKVEHNKVQKAATRLRKLAKKNRKKAARRGRQLEDLHSRLKRLSTANVVWIGRKVENTHLHTSRAGSGPQRHHWVRGHWWPKVLSTITIRAQAELTYQAAKDRVWKIRAQITEEPGDLDMVEYAAELEEAARELGEASLALAKVSEERDTVNALPRRQATGTKKRRWVQPYERNKDADESVPSHHYKM